MELLLDHNMQRALTSKIQKLATNIPLEETQRHDLVVRSCS